MPFDSSATLPEGRKGEEPGGGTAAEKRKRKKSKKWKWNPDATPGDLTRKPGLGVLRNPCCPS